MTRHEFYYEVSWQNIQMLMQSIPRYEKPKKDDPKSKYEDSLITNPDEIDKFVEEFNSK